MIFAGERVSDLLGREGVRRLHEAGRVQEVTSALLPPQAGERRGTVCTHQLHQIVHGGDRALTIAAGICPSSSPAQPPHMAEREEKGVEMAALLGGVLPSFSCGKKELAPLCSSSTPLPSLTTPQHQAGASSRCFLSAPQAAVPMVLGRAGPAPWWRAVEQGRPAAPRT